MRPQVLKLRLKGHVYPIMVGNGIVSKLGVTLKKSGYEPRDNLIFIIADKSLVEHRKQLLRTLTRSGWKIHEIPVKAGEELKNIKSITRIYNELLENKADRKSLVIALGGGTIGDVAGFVASTYMRGIDWVGIPTTLLSQVDSSVGGKTGVNLLNGKNIVGTFHQPKLVLCETNYLKTLPKREHISGLGEVIKYALTYDPKLFEYLKINVNKLNALDPVILNFIVKRSLSWKVLAVQKDEKDLKGIREVLNFGHTFGHALETITHFKKFKHGEAVLWGLRFALALSIIKKNLSEEDFMRINSLLMELKIPSMPRELDLDKMGILMKKDKKSVKGEMRFILLKGLGRPVVGVKVSERDLKEAYAMLKGEKL